MADEDGYMDDFTPADIDKILEKMPDNNLAAAYQRAEPAKAWKRQLSEEIGRRDGKGSKRSR